MEDDDGRGVGGGEGLACLLAAQGIEGTDDGEMHASTLMRMVLKYNRCGAQDPELLPPTEGEVPLSG